jgi:hypothetical protein
MADEQKGTEYVILVREPIDISQTGDDSFAWLEMGRQRGTNDIAAIRAWVKDHPSGTANSYAAIPARSWRPRRREVKTVQRDLWT